MGLADALGLADSLALGLADALGSADFLSSLADGLVVGVGLAFLGCSLPALFCFLVPEDLLPELPPVEDLFSPVAAGGTVATLAAGLTIKLGLTVADGVVVVPVQATSVAPKLRQRSRLID